VHSSFIGHAVVGDPVYSKVEDKFGLNGQLLVATNIEFTHPRTGERMKFEVELPDYFTAVLDKMN
jgi:23S rRNA pseudouridine1911/1915/1917 synthase